MDLYSVEDADLAAKTAATMKFISDSRKFIKNTTDQKAIEVLELSIEKLLNTEYELEEWTTPEEFLTSLQNMPEVEQQSEEYIELMDKDFIENENSF